MNQNLVFVSGKGGVGKTVVSHAIALRLAKSGKRTLWVTFEDPTKPRGEVRQLGERLWFLNCDAQAAFEEYAAMKIGSGPLSRLFIQNKLMQYLAKAAPGVHELVLLGKVWHERLNYDAVVADMPATGHGLAMFQSTKNFTTLFKGGPLHRDAESMLETFGDPKQTRQLIVSLPEEMPLRESLELNDFLRELFPHNPPAFLVNRLFPRVAADTGTGGSEKEIPSEWPTPVPASVEDYARKRGILENYNLRIWRDAGIQYDELEYVLPPPGNGPEEIARALAEQMADRNYP